ncbi:MAG: hypothetical protein M1838_000455 [Thelocarpon superellum]|nr:MAG: hypothetical protein M1838_000455 [Thelocarpon superellum]
MKIFARNNGSYVFYGTHSETGQHGHHEWVISGVSLATGQVLERRIHLENFVGSDMGMTVSFEIHGPHFYALSNQTSFDVEEVDWTSSYHCCRFPLDNVCQQTLESRVIWRRNHVEGPINDSWTDLRLHADEGTGKLMIVECRREWQGGGSMSQRTYYMQPLEFPAEVHIPSATDAITTLTTSEDGDETTDFEAADTLPNEAIVLMMDESDKPHYSRPKPRLPRYVHRGDDGNVGSSRSFILARTKLRYYNPSCNAFIDLVDDPEDPPCDGGIRRTSRLRLRIGSRRLGPTKYDKHGLLQRPPPHPITGEPLDGAEETFIERQAGIRMWPAARSALQDEKLEALHNILNPGPCPNRKRSSSNSSSKVEVDGIADERSIVYLSGSASDTERAIVFVNFDRGIQLAGLDPFETSTCSPPTTASPSSASSRAGDSVTGDRSDTEDAKASGPQRIVILDTDRRDRTWRRNAKSKSKSQSQSKARLVLDPRPSSILGLSMSASAGSSFGSGSGSGSGSKRVRLDEDQEGSGRAHARACVEADRGYDCACDCDCGCDCDEFDSPHRERQTTATDTAKISAAKDACWLRREQAAYLGLGMGVWLR